MKPVKICSCWCEQNCRHSQQEGLQRLHSRGQGHGNMLVWGMVLQVVAAGNLDLEGSGESGTSFTTEDSVATAQFVERSSKSLSALKPVRMPLPLRRTHTGCPTQHPFIFNCLSCSVCVLC